MTTTTTDTTAPPTNSTNNTLSISRQLKAASLGTMLFSLMISFGSHPATDLPLRWFSDLIFWPAGDPVSELTDEARLLAAILGGVMTGFAVFVWMLTHALIEEHPLLLRKIILTVMAVWFIVDSTGSFAAGAPLNVAANVGYLAMFVLPARRLA